MYKILSHLIITLATAFLLLFANACKKDHPPPDVPAPANDFLNYIKKEGVKFRLYSAVAIFDTLSSGETVFSVGIYNKNTDQTFIVFDYLVMQNTFQLLPGTFPYQKLLNTQPMQVGHFHDIILKCNSPVIDALTHPVSQTTLILNRTGTKYLIESKFLMDGKRYEVHYEGKIQHVRAW